MSAPTASLSVLRGDPTPEELAALVVALGAIRRVPDDPGPPPATEPGWGRSPGWTLSAAAATTHAAAWRRTPAPHHGRSIR